MTFNDILGLVLSYIYAFGLLFVVEALGKKFNWSQNSTRKIIHIGAGLWVWGIIALFDSWYFGIIPFFTFIFLNYMFYRNQSFSQMDTEESTPGTVYFAFSITVLFLLFWRTDTLIDRLQIAVAATMAMTLGDAFAAIVGQAWGKHIYHVFGNKKSLIGSASMFVCALIGIFVSLFFVPGTVLSPNSAVLSLSTTLSYSLLAAIVATAAEAVSPSGTDNLSVPLLTGIFLYVLIG